MGGATVHKAQQAQEGGGHRLRGPQGQHGSHSGRRPSRHVMSRTCRRGGSGTERLRARAHQASSEELSSLDTMMAPSLRTLLLGGAGAGRGRGQHRSPTYPDHPYNPRLVGLLPSISEVPSMHCGCCYCPTSFRHLLVVRDSPARLPSCPQTSWLAWSQGLCTLAQLLPTWIRSLSPAPPAPPCPRDHAAGHA
jgi:hypothetical protein